jgi:plastocyanin
VAGPAHRPRPPGRARTIDAPPGKLRRLNGGTTLNVSRSRFWTPRLSVPRGTTLRWRFPGSEPHNVTLASGPVGFASLNLANGASFKERLKKPGVYRLFCSLHPVQMQQVVTVR